MNSCNFMAVVDDNIEICSSLERKITALFPNLSIPFHKCSNFKSLEHFLAGKEDKTGVIFVDICQGKENGIDYVIELQKKKVPWKYVYITGYPQMVSDTFHSTPSGILCKPIDDEHLRDTLLRLFKEIESEANNTITVQIVKNGIRKIPAHIILYVESNLRVLQIHTENETLSTYGRLSEFAAELPDYFIHCHKSYIINTRKITDYQTTHIVLSDGRKIPVSRPHIKEVRDAFFDGLRK